MKRQERRDETKIKTQEIYQMPRTAREIIFERTKSLDQQSNLTPEVEARKMRQE
jgi:hypothetical protein